MRCSWARGEEYLPYHDEEWGRPVVDDDALFERLCLEGLQAGLSWLTILRKRPAFREAFAGFSIDAVARFGARDVRRLMADAGDEQRGLDPTVNALQERVAELLGQEAALFLPTGTLCNEISIRLHIRP